STITQQLVRNLYPGYHAGTLTRKIEEACLATKLADRWSKRKILGTYLNRIFYGNHAYGAQAAAQTYFSRSAAKLTLAQAALLAGLPQAPTVYDPFRHPARALARRNQVLRAMLDNGEIGSWLYLRAARQPLGLERGKLYNTIHHWFYYSYVR